MAVHPSVDDLLEQGLARINKGTSIAMTAEVLVRGPWATLSSDTKQELAISGLAYLLASALKRQRESDETAAERDKRKSDNAAAKVSLALLNTTVHRSFKYHRLIKCTKHIDEERFHMPASKRHDPHACVIANLGHVLKTGNNNKIYKVITAIAAKNTFAQSRIDANEKLPIAARAQKIFDAAILNVLGRIKYKCDSGMRPLLDFRVTDAKTLQSTSEGQVRAWTARMAWFQEAAATMIKARVDIVSDLPQADLQRLGQAAEKTWRKSQRSWLPKATLKLVKGGSTAAGGSESA